MRSVLLLAVLAVPAAAQVSPTTVTLTMTDCSGAANSIAVDVYKPAGTAPYPTVALGHGFVMDKGTMGGLAKNLAAAGILVVVPQFPRTASTPCGGADHARNGRILLAALDAQVTAGQADTTKLGIGGHSAGGLAAFLAASNRALQVAVVLDGVDNSSLGQNAASKVTAPTFFLNAEPTACSSQNNSSTWYAPKPAPKARLKIINATHCDAEDPVVDPLLCITCGAVNAARTAAFKTYASAFFRRYLLNQNMPCLETTAAGDTAVTSIDFQLGGCEADGGVGGGGGSTGGGSGSTGGGSAATGGGTGSTGGGSGSTGGGTVATGGGTGSTGGGTAATGGGTGSTGGGSVATGGGTSATGGGNPAGGGSGGGGSDGGGCSCNSLPAGSLLGLLALVSRRRRQTA